MIVVSWFRIWRYDYSWHSETQAKFIFFWGCHMVIEPAIFIPCNDYCSIIPIFAIHYSVDNTSYPNHSLFYASWWVFADRNTWNHPRNLREFSRFEVTKYF